jgi:hypothetical protein
VKNRTIRYQTRLSELEAERLDEMADAEQISRGELTRAALMEKWRRFLKAKDRQGRGNARQHQ